MVAEIATKFKDSAFDLETQLIEGRGGVFDVKLDGDLIFSKQQVDRFPNAGEVSEIIEARLADASASG